MTDSRCEVCPLIAQYEAEYERKAAEMRRMINQANEQLAVSVREIQQLQARVAALQQSQAVSESVTNCDLAKREEASDG